MSTLYFCTSGKGGIYRTWQLEESDLIQHSAKAFGERLITDQFSSVLNTCGEDLKPILQQVFNLFVINVVERDLAWFVSAGLLNPNQVYTGWTKN